MRNEIIKLITETAQGSEIIREDREVFAEKKSVTRSEFYGAYQSGLNPKYIFVIDSLDYEMTRSVTDTVETYAQKLEYNDAVFNVIRVYDDGADVELTVG